MEKVENIKPNYYNNTNISPFDVIELEQVKNHK